MNVQNTDSQVQKAILNEQKKTIRGYGVNC